MIDIIIVQAGGKGTRMEYLTANKPKCLVPINNLPILFHLFKKYPDKKFIIIGDYKYEVLQKYLRIFAKVSYLLVDARGSCGTCAGLKQAFDFIQEEQSFMLIWSDLILPKEYKIPKENGNYIGLSGNFSCRWKYENGDFKEESSTEHGVAGLFVFQKKEVLKNIPQKGEFVQWLKTQDIYFKEQVLSKTKEYGLMCDYKKQIQTKCRPFNRITVYDNQIIKEGIDNQGKELARKEKAWYHYIETMGFCKIPKIYSYNPFKMEKIEGKNVYEYEELSYIKKKKILIDIINSLKELHSFKRCNADYFSIKETYVDKTFSRLSLIRNLIPFAEKKYIQINEKNCKNIFFYQEELERRLYQYRIKEFQVIHGDCTFSNIMLNKENTPILIDPRGYFGKVEFYGDPAYDWAKLYYSIVGNYDQFNLKNFKLHIKETEVLLEIKSNGWEELETVFFEQLKDEINVDDIKLLHAIIWLSLTSYAWEDYDSICGAFYLGLYYLEEIL